MQITSHTRSGVDKTVKYGWITKDEPGSLEMIHKDLLKIDDRYQRDVIVQKVMDITSAWSWLACGALIVGRRNGEYWVIDGQHRAIAAKRRSEIKSLPCLVFETYDIRQEAKGFLDANTGRRPVTAAGKQKALVVAGDPIACFVNETCEQLGIKIRTSAVSKPRELKCIRWRTKRAALDKIQFKRVLSLVAELCDEDNMGIQERLLEGIWVLNQRCGAGLSDRRLEERIRQKGAKALLHAANKAAAYFVTGGSKVWADGMLIELNKGLQKKFFMDSETQEH